MKKLTPLIAIALLLSIQSSAQKKQTKQPSVTKIELSSAKWTYQEGKVEFTNYKGRPAMKIAQRSGPVVLKDVVFKDGTIEYDVEPVVPEFAESVYFHRKDEKEQEIVYLRVPKIDNPFANEGIQYCPYFNGVNMWDMYPQYQAPAPAKAGEWNHIKLVISGKQMHVFVNGALTLEIPKLEGRETEGSIAFEGSSYISNVDIKPGETERLSPEEGADLTKHEANYIRKWSVTQPALLPSGTEPTTVNGLPANESFTGKAEAERGGLINLTRQFGGNEKRRIIWLKTTITAKEPVKTRLQLGFSDEIWLYLNDQITYTDKNIFPQNMKKYPDGRISASNGSVEIKLKQGTNDLMIGVANDFYGWGMIARLESTDEITGIEAYKAPVKIAIENIDLYTGVYATKDNSLKLTFTKKGDDLISQVNNREDQILLTYAGNHIFKVERMGVELKFIPADKKVILKENGNETELLKQ